MSVLLTSALIILLGQAAFFVSPKSHEAATAAFSAVRQNADRVVKKLPLSAELLPQAIEAVNPIPAEYLPVRNWQVLPPEIDATAAVIVGSESGKVFYERNMRERLPIASLTKLMTALVAVDEMLLTEEVTVSRHAVSTGGDFGNLAVGETLSMHDLLRSMLIASSNDAAVALSEHLEKTKGSRMTELMNAKAYALELTNTRFVSVSGLEDRNNYSTAQDVSRFFKAALANSVLADILKTSDVDIRSLDGAFTHRLVTSNKLMNRFDGVIGGKTGFTEGAGGCLALLARNGKAHDDFLVVLLGSSNEQTRFEAAEKLITWVNEAYRW